MGISFGRKIGNMFVLFHKCKWFEVFGVCFTFSWEWVGEEYNYFSNGSLSCLCPQNKNVSCINWKHSAFCFHRKPQRKLTNSGQRKRMT